MAAVYRNYGDFTTPTPVAIGSRAFPNWGSTFAGDLGAWVNRTNLGAVVLERTFNSYAWINSGIMQPNANVNIGTGHLAEVPMIRPFKAQKEYVLSNTTWGASGKGHLTVQKINGDSAFTPIQQMAFAGGADDLSAWESGTDPIGIMVSYFTENQQRMATETLSSLMDAFFGTGGVLNSTHLLDVTTTPTPTEANFLSAATLMRAKSLIGERGQRLQVIAMHSNVANYLATVGMLTFSTSALATGGNIAWGGGGVGITNTMIADMAGFRVVVDDTLVPTGTGATQKYPVYMFEPGVVSTGFRNGMRIAYERNILSFQNVVAADWSAAVGVLGISWKAGSTIQYPTDAELATPANWELKVSDHKDIGLIKVLVNNPW
jgi:hypothetical protein